MVSAGSVYKCWCWCWTSIGGTQKATRLQRQLHHHPATWSMQLACRTKDRLVSLVLPPPACSADKLVSGASVEQASHLGSALLTVLCSQCSAHSALLTPDANISISNSSCGEGDSCESISNEMEEVQVNGSFRLVAARLCFSECFRR